MANALLEIPVRSDIPSYEFAIQLELVTYYLGFNWSDRQGVWTMDISDALKNPIVMGIRLFSDLDLVGRFQQTGLPPGSFFIFDTAGGSADPGRDNFGTQVLLMYIESVST